MESNLYEAPQSTLSDVESLEDKEFYVVSIKKFTILFMATFGFYSIYWFYRNWKMSKAKYRDDIWPVARGIFSIFFVHSLFDYVAG